MLKEFYILISFLLLTCFVSAQNHYSDSAKVLGSTIIEGDTLPNYDISEIKVFPEKVFKNRRQKRRYTRLMYNVKKAYPFALVARDELRIMNDSLQYIEGDRERKKFINEYEKEMFFRYEAGLRKLTFSQGRILFKLVDREIGNAPYYLIKEYRGSFSAVFWQGISRLFGSNLKTPYDPNGDDADIELIVQMIEAGVI